MLDLTFSLIVAVTFTFFLAGVVKGVAGMGLPTVAMGMLGTVISPVAAAAFLVVPTFVTNIWQLLSGPNFSAVGKRLWLMMVGIVVGTVGGSSVLAGDNGRWTTVALGIALMVYSGFTLMARQLSVPQHAEKWLSPLIGVTTGIVAGATGVFVIPAVPYLQALGLSRDDLIQALGLTFTVSTLALAAGLVWHGAFRIDNLAMSSLAIIPAMLGMALGQVIRGKVSPTTFRHWFLLCLMVLGADLVIRQLL